MAAWGRHFSAGSKQMHVLCRWLLSHFLAQNQTGRFPVSTNPRFLLGHGHFGWKDNVVISGMPIDLYCLFTQ
jgi:hypothetical protein